MTFRQRQRIGKRNDKREALFLLFILPILICLLFAFMGRGVQPQATILKNPLPISPTHEVSVLEIKTEIVAAEKPRIDEKTAQCIQKRQHIAEKIKTVFNDHWEAAAIIICRESSFNHRAINPSSGSCGLGQALPCKKMKCDLDDVDCQLAWVKQYIKERYKTPENALAYHNLKNWY